MQRMIVDCDPGHDDAIALMVAHRHAQVVGITTVSGNVPLAATTANALLLTALLDVDTPVHAGAPRPLVGEPRHAPHVHGASGLGDVSRMAHDKAAAGEDAVCFLLEAAAPDVWIVALGPLTNVALAIERDPGWVKRIAGISLMGGSACGGNVTPVAEFNVYADPEAARRVFRSGADIIMCGLDLTHQITTTDAFAERLRAAGTAAAGFAADVFDDLHGRIAALTGRREAALHDPCAVLTVTHPELIDTVPRAVDVELDGTLTRGMTVVDQRPLLRADPATARVGWRIDADRALQVVLRSLGAEPTSRGW